MSNRVDSVSRKAPPFGAGFTLIEVVVALAIVALIAVSLFESLRFSQAAHRKVIQHGGAAWDVFASQRLIRSLVESAYPQQPAPTDATPAFGLEGDKENISITAHAPLAAGGIGLQRYEIRASRGEAATVDVVVRWRADYASASTALPSAAVARETLIENVASIEWSYLRENPKTGDGAWLDEWRGQQPLPRLVRLRVRFPKGDSRIWPQLVMAPRLTDDANCRFDVVAQRCRSGS